MTMTPERSFALSDRYRSTEGEILCTGVQALVRVPLDQLRADRRNGLKTAAFVSGYQGSPLGGYDRELAAQRALTDELGLVHTPALNEELGATAVLGSQLVSTRPNARYDGVIGVWYGKAPGLDRAGDAIRHANWAGTARNGGVLALVGDDPACKSSTLPSRSDIVLEALGLPVLYPGTVQQLIDLGLHGIAMSRASGLWTAMKIVTPVADGSGLAYVHPDRIRPKVDTLTVDGRAWQPTLSGRIAPPYTVGLEAEVLGTRHEMAMRYVVENQLNSVRANPTNAWLGIIAGGYIAEQVIAALGALGVSLEEAARLGVRLLQLGVLHPLDVDAVRRLADGCATVLVVEDKLAHLETLVRDALYPLAQRPAVIGKRDLDGSPLIPFTGIIDAGVLREPLRRVLATQIGAERLTPPPPSNGLQLTIRTDAIRTPYFCSGCPHNTGTLAPDDALVGSGIGCHGMVTFTDLVGRGDVMGSAQMGGEGSQWIGMAPFLETTHMFQNIGDGTFFHSGQLSVQAAIAAGVSMTFKILYNSAVAMTGGQDAAGLLPVPQLTAKLLAEGVREVVITTDEPEKYRRVRLPDGASVRHRDDIVTAQEYLRTVPGVTVLIHDQQCAAEKRRDRKRGLLVTPKQRVVIDERICEGCGDCGRQSNCLSLQPVDTPFGRKTTVDQASCNLDISCVKGDCPAFVTVIPDPSARRTSPPPPADVPQPTAVTPAEGATIRMPGIGGTGVVTVSQLLAAAAKIDGIDSSAVDQTGLSQKAGPVVSTISLGTPAAASVDVLVAFDLLVAVTRANVRGLDGHTVVIASTTVAPTGRMIGHVADAGIDIAAYRDELDRQTNAANNRYCDAGALANGLFGSSVAANVLLLGVAYQAGAIPLQASSIERALELNGTAVEANRDAFRWGRAWVVDPAAVERAAGMLPPAVAVTGFTEFEADDALRAIVARCHGDLVDYQDRRYADRYLARLRTCFAAERASGGDGRFTRTVADQLHRVMAYKDEYEVARLALDGRQRLSKSLGAPIDSVTYHLHPPVLRALGMRRKLRLQRTAGPVFRLLRAAKRLRGTPLDPFGRAAMRRSERALIAGYEVLVDELAASLSAANLESSTHLAGLVEMVRGYESVKQRNLDAYAAALAATHAATQAEAHAG
jgi:indolepyruvate ferredoxin oxidoreductase